MDEERTVHSTRNNFIPEQARGGGGGGEACDESGQPTPARSKEVLSGSYPCLPFYRGGMTRATPVEARSLRYRPSPFLPPPPHPTPRDEASINASIIEFAYHRLLRGETAIKRGESLLKRGMRGTRPDDARNLRDNDPLLREKVSRKWRFQPRFSSP